MFGTLQGRPFPHPPLLSARHRVLVPLYLHCVLLQITGMFPFPPSIRVRAGADPSKPNPGASNTSCDSRSNVKRSRSAVFYVWEIMADASSFGFALTVSLAGQ